MSVPPEELPRTGGANLSDTRGPKAGILFMRCVLAVFGITAACFCVRIVALFYTLTDRTAGKRAMPYLKHRFPGSHGAGMLLHVWRLFSAQGEALVTAFALAHGKITVRERNPQIFSPCKDTPGGMVFLCSHFGPWQAAMHCVNAGRREVAFVAKNDSNANVDKRTAFGGAKSGGEPMRIIDTAGAFGGLLDAFELLDSGGAVGLMGDRCLENDFIVVDFLGAPAKFPVAAYLLAARANVPVIPFFLVRGKSRRELLVEFSDITRSSGRGRGRGRFQADVQSYARALERMTREHPYECFLFDDLWEL